MSRIVESRASIPAACGRSATTGSPRPAVPTTFASEGAAKRIGAVKPSSPARPPRPGVQGGLRHYDARCPCAGVEPRSGTQRATSPPSLPAKLSVERPSSDDQASRHQRGSSRRVAASCAWLAKDVEKRTDSPSSDLFQAGGSSTDGRRVAVVQYGQTGALYQRGTTVSVHRIPSARLSRASAVRRPHPSASAKAT
jgi:hypothetical protein